MIKKIWIIFVAIVVLMIPVVLFDCLGHKYELGLISLDKIVNTTQELTSEKFEGRFIGSKGHQYTQEYILESLKSMGYDTTVQEFTTLAPVMGSESYFEIGKKIINSDEYRLITGGFSGSADFTGELIFLNETTPYEDETVKNRVLVASSLGEISDAFIEKLIDSGCSGIFIPPGGRYDISKIQYDVSAKKGKTIPIIYISDEIYEYLTELAEASTLEPRNVYFNDSYASVEEKTVGVVTDVTIRTDFDFEMVKGKNIFASLPNNESDEILMFNSNYDGRGKTNENITIPGTFSNATSVAFNLGIADRIKSDGKYLTKKVVFSFLDATILGGKGSEYYISNPIYDLNKSTIIGFDALGSSGTEILSVSEKGNFLKNEILQYTERLGLAIKNARLMQFSGTANSDFKNFSYLENRVVLIGSNLSRFTDIYYGNSEVLDAQNLKNPIILLDYYLKESVYNDYFPEYMNKYEWIILFVIIIWSVIIIVINKLRKTKFLNVDMAVLYYSLPYSIIRNLYNVIFIFITTTFIILGISRLPNTFDVSYFSNKIIFSHSFYSLWENIIITLREFRLEGFGISSMGVPYFDIIIQNAFNSFKILSISLILSIIIGSFIGMISCYFKKQHNSNQSILVIFGLSIPEALITFLLLLFMPVISQIPFIKNSIDVSQLRTIYMPIFTISFIPTIYISRIVYIALVGELKKKYIISLKAKGVNKFRLYKNHLLKICFSRVLEMMPIILSIGIANMIMCEYIFSIPGVIINMFNSLKLQEYKFFLGLTISIMVFYYISLLTSKLILKLLVPKSGGTYEVE